MITGVHQIAITVKDLDSGIAFYRDVLGLQLLFQAPPGLAFFQCGQTRLMLSAVPEVDPSRRMVLYYATPDINAAVDDLRRRGAAITQEPQMIARVENRDVWLAVTEDPDGHVVGLMSEVPVS
ncbi:MAG: VOC family protein [Acidobacteriota bacterium]